MSPAQDGLPQPSPLLTLWVPSPLIHGKLQNHREMGWEIQVPNKGSVSWVLFSQKPMIKAAQGHGSQQLNTVWDKNTERARTQWRTNSLPIGFGAQNPLYTWLSWWEAGWWAKESSWTGIWSENMSQARRQGHVLMFPSLLLYKGVLLMASHVTWSKSLNLIASDFFIWRGRRLESQLISEVLLARGVLWVTLQGWVLFGPWGYLLRPFMPSALTPSLHVKRGFLSLNHPGEGGQENPGAPPI